MSQSFAFRLILLLALAACTSDSPTTMAPQRSNRVPSLLASGGTCGPAIGPLLSISGVTSDGTLQNFAELYATPFAAFDEEGATLTEAEGLAIETATEQADAEIRASVPFATIQLALASADAIGDPCWKPYEKCISACANWPTRRARQACYIACMTAYAACRGGGYIKKRFT